MLAFKRIFPSSFSLARYKYAMKPHWHCTVRLRGAPHQQWASNSLLRLEELYPKPNQVPTTVEARHITIPTFLMNTSSPKLKLGIPQVISVALIFGRDEQVGIDVEVSSLPIPSRSSGERIQ
jgi:hypothetical protein